MTTTLTLTSADDGQTFNNYRISTTSGPCIVLDGVTNVTIENSNIGPCGTNNSSSDSNGIEIDGGSGVNIYDSYIHIQNIGSGGDNLNPTNTHYNIWGNGATNVTVQGNVIMYGSRNVILSSGSNGWVVNGNFIAQPRGGDGGGNNFQAADSWNELLENNYVLSCDIGNSDTHQPACPSNFLYTEDEFNDNVSFWYSSAPGGNAGTVSGNYVAGGYGATGSGIDADQDANGLTVTNNTVLEVANVEIIQNSGTGFVLSGNKVWSNNAAPNSDLTGMVNQNDGVGTTSCSTLTNNAANTWGGAASPNGYWGNITCSTDSGNSFGSDWSGLTSDMTAAQVMTQVPPPAIPPLPKNCVVKSPYSNNTSKPSC